MARLWATRPHTSPPAGPGAASEGNAELRNAIIELGRGLAQRDPDFARYRTARMKLTHPPATTARKTMPRT